MSTEHETNKRRYIEDFMKTMGCTKEEAIKFLAMANNGFEHACVKLIRYRKGW